MSPSICLILCPSGDIGTVGSEACSINLVQAPGAGTSILRPTTYLLDDVNVSKRSRNVLPPWPPPWFVSVQDVNMCKDMLQALLLDGLVLQSMQVMLWAGKYRWPPPFSNMGTVEFIRRRIGIWLCCFGPQGAEVLIFCFAACSNSNLHGTMDIMQISRDLHFLRTVEIEWNATIAVINFALGALSVRLQPTVFRWSDLSYNIHFLSASTLYFLLVRRDASIVWNCCCLDNLHCYLGSTNWAFEEEQGQVLLRMPWQSFRYHWESAYLMKPCSAIQGTFRCELFYTGNTWDCLHYEHLQQWRPPDQITEFLSVQLQLESRNMGGITSMKENLPAQLLEVYIILCRLTSNHFPAELIVIEHWLIPWEPGDDSPGHNLMEIFNSLAITCELHYSIAVVDSLLTARYWLRFAWKQISKILSEHRGPGSRLSLRHIADLKTTPNLARWLSSPALDNLEVIKIYYHYELLLPVSVFRFAPTLRQANLGGCRFPEDAPPDLAFPHLKHLVLKDVEISEGALHGLLSACPALEILQLDWCGGFDQLVIDSPTLRSFGVVADGYLDRLVIQDAPRLERLIAFDYMDIRVISAPRLQVVGLLDSYKTTLHVGPMVSRGISTDNLAMSMRSVKLFVLDTYGPDLDAVIVFIKFFPCLEKIYITLYLEVKLKKKNKRPLNPQHRIECLDHSLR